MHLPTGSCHPPLLPTASCCPKSSSGPCAASLGTSGSWGWSHFPGSPLPPLARGIFAECGLDTLFLCLSQLWGPARQPLAVVVAARVAMSRWDSFPCLRKRQRVFSLWGTTAAPWWGEWLVGVCKATGSPVGCGTFLSGPRLSVAPAHPRGACVARGGAAARPCLWEAVAIPLRGSAPCTLLSKTPSMLQRAPHPGKGLNPRVPPLKVVAVLEQGWCCWEMVPLGVGRGISGRAGAAPRSRSKGRSSAGHCHRCLTPSQRLSLSSFFMSSPGKAPGMKNNPSACVLACRAQSSVKFIQPSLGAAVGC